MSEKWTPGPWSLSTLSFAMNDGAIPVIAAETRICLVDPQGKVKRGAGHLHKCDVREANAKLIAAAPDLAEALKWFLDDPRFDVAVGGNPTAVDEMFAKARAALTRAGGVG